MEHKSFEQAAAELEISVDAYLRMVRLFTEDTRSQLIQLEAAIQARDTESADRITHHIAGAAENLEFTTFARAARQLRVALASFEAGDSLDALASVNPGTSLDAEASSDVDGSQIKEAARSVYEEFRAIETTLARNKDD